MSLSGIARSLDLPLDVVVNYRIEVFYLESKHADTQWNDLKSVLSYMEKNDPFPEGIDCSSNMYLYILGVLEGSNYGLPSRKIRCMMSKSSHSDGKSEEKIDTELGLLETERLIKVDRTCGLNNWYLLDDRGKSLVKYVNKNGKMPVISY